VCHVLSFGQFGGTWFIAMEYLHGVPLSRMMTRLSKVGKMLDVRIVAGIIVQACEGLHAAHEARGPDGQPLGLVHRDVSPPNIMVCGDGAVKLLDFGTPRRAARTRGPDRHGQGQERVHVARADPRQGRSAKRRVRARGRDV
jgi:serine/threonine-protein kinase